MLTFMEKKTPVVYMYGIVANRIMGVKFNTSRATLYTIPLDYIINKKIHVLKKRQ